MDIIEITDEYVKYDISDMQSPICRLEDFYRDSGILNFLDVLVQHSDIGPEDIVILPQHILRNKKTRERLEEAIEITWREYNVDRNSGTYKRNKPHKYSKPHSLSQFDKNTLSMHFLNLAPTDCEEVPDDQCWVKKNLTITRGKRK